MPVLVGVGLCSFMLGTRNFLQMPHFFAAIASGVDCSAFSRAVAILSSSPVASVRGFCWLLLVVENVVNGNRVFFRPACYQKRVLCSVLTLCKFDHSGQVELLLLQQLLSQGLGGTLFDNLVSDHFLL